MTAPFPIPRPEVFPMRRRLLVLLAVFGLLAARVHRR